MRSSSNFFDVFLRGSGPSGALLGAFTLGLIVIGLLSNLFYGFLTNQEAIDVTWVRVLGATLALTAVAYGLYAYDRRRNAIQVVIDESRQAPAHPHLLWVLGPGSIEHLVWALNHHHAQGGAAGLWLLMKPSEAVERAYRDLSQDILERGLRTQVHRIEISELDARSAYMAVTNVVQRLRPQAPNVTAGLIVDITGGTKPLSAGMVLAAITTGTPLEYVESRRDAQGHPIGGLQVVQVDINFYGSTPPL